MGWYKKLKPPRSKADRKRSAIRRTPSGQRERKPPRIRPLKHVFYRTYSTAVYIDGYRAKVITRNGIAKLFDVPLITVHTWDRLGVLPEPLMVLDRGAYKVPVFLCAQIRCLMIVMSDLVGEGYVSIQWKALDEYMEMLHDGYDEAMRAFKTRLTGEVYGGLAGKHGVTVLTRAK